MRTARLSLILFLIGLLSVPLTYSQQPQKTVPLKEANKKVAPRRTARQAPEVKLTNARITFEHTEFDFGSISKGTKITHNFWFENTGVDTLVITRVKPT